ncbi:hypothetical protein GCK32_001308 [Trichostrongylus colubriformis]|uniref:Uncharacterized protein n=1 Tax=Trichostrongylus colubriformis TaxID=6319 RepID=A0AAN8G0E5_TRICO
MLQIDNFLKSLLPVPVIPPSDKVLLMVIDGCELLFWIAMNMQTPFREMMKLTQLYTGIDHRAYWFYCHGWILLESHTPSALQLRNYDVISLVPVMCHPIVHTTSFSPAGTRAPKRQE